MSFLGEDLLGVFQKMFYSPGGYGGLGCSSPQFLGAVSMIKNCPRCSKTVTKSKNIVKSDLLVKQVCSSGKSLLPKQYTLRGEVGSSGKDCQEVVGAWGFIH
jgi:hypothetical protein